MPLRTLYRLALGAAAVVTASDYVLDVLPVTGDSMAPTLSPDYHETGRRDVLLFDKWMSASRGSVSGDEAGHAQRQRIRRGDVVSFWAPHKPERRSVKRVVALEGDTVFLDSRAAGAPLSDLHRPAPSQDVVVVPFGHVWVEGDNAGWSVDSRTFGPISKRLITGKAKYIIWPPVRAGRVSDHHTSGSSSRTNVVPGAASLPAEFLE